jgi:glycosyltransferase involved in cell wall biosynthesis
MGKAGDIVVTTSTLPCYAGDPQPRFVLDLAIGMVGFFRKVHVLASAAPGAADEEQVQGVHVLRYRYAWPAAMQQVGYRFGILQNLRRNPLLVALLPSFYAAQGRALARLCRENPVTVVNSHWLAFQGLAAVGPCRRLGIRHVAHSHGADVDLLHRLPGALGRRLAQRVAGGCQRIICESSHVRQRLDALLGRPSNAAVSCMGVDASRFAAIPPLDPPPPTILFVGRLVEKKGVEYLVRAMPAVRARFPSARLRIAGSGVLEPAIRTLAGRLGADGAAVEFLGARPHAEVSRFMSEAGVVAIPSIVDSHGEADGMPTVLLEAMAAGRRVVASRVDGIPDVLKDGVNGWMCQPRDPQDLAEKLILALESRDLAIIREARHTAGYYDWPALAARYAALVEGK